MDGDVHAKVYDGNVAVRVLGVVGDVLGSAMLVKGEREEGALEVSVDDAVAAEVVGGGEDVLKREVCARLETLVKFDLGG